MATNINKIDLSKENNLIDVNKLNLLMELVAKINSNLELKNILKEIMNATKEIMSAEASSLFLLSEDKKDLILTVPTGPLTAELSGKKIPLTSGISGWVIQNKKLAVVKDVSKDSRFGGDLGKGSSFKTKNIICVPLINHNNEVIGALQAINSLQLEKFGQDNAAIFQTMANQAAIAVENALLHKERLNNQLLNKEIELASTIQSGFWPKKQPMISNYKVAGCSIPAKNVGGDYFDYISLPNKNNWGFTVADVTGKGVSAALLMATMRASLRSHLEYSNTPNISLTKVNELIFNDSPLDKFITAIYCELDSIKNTIRYVNAGHNNPYVLDVEKNSISTLDVGGLMLGILDTVKYDEEVYEIKSNQKIILYSDGITEARDVKGDFYGEKRFENWLLDNKNLDPDAMVKGITEELIHFRNEAEQSDDITIIVIQRLG